MDNDEQKNSTLDNTFDEMTDDEINELEIKCIQDLVAVLPDPNNDKEIQEFIDFIQNPPISGDTDAERVWSFLDLAKTQPDLFNKYLAFNILSSDLITMGELSKKLTNKETKVESISTKEIEDIKNNDSEEKFKSFREQLKNLKLK